MTRCRAVAVGVLTLGMMAGAQAFAANATPLEDLAGSEWGFPWSKDAYVQFRQGGDVTGFAGCNRFRGAYTYKDGVLKIGPLATTRMACPQLDVERRVLQTLDGAVHAEATHLKLVLKDAAGRELVTLQRRDFD